MKQMTLTLAATLLALGVCHADQPKLADKTLVVWAAPSTLDQGGGSALTVDDLAGGFDGVILAELASRRWMAGSNFHRRTQKGDQQSANAEETAQPGQFVQVAIVYQDRRIQIFRDGRPYASYEVDNPATYDAPWFAMFGTRHLQAGDDKTFLGQIDDARVYDRALTAEEIQSLQANKDSDSKPVAWWTFEDGSIKDQTGLFSETLLMGDAVVRDGKLVLSTVGDRLIAMPSGWGAANVQMFQQTDGGAQALAVLRQHRRRLLDDPLRPVWHLTIPEGRGMPFDPNGAIFWNGQYHLWYIYQAEFGHHWAHVSSLDLLHWRWRRNDLAGRPGDAESGIFSGNCFLAANGEAVICYHGVGSGGNCVAVSTDPELDHWIKPESNPVAVPGWDPHAWFQDGVYYQISGGNPPILYRGDSYEEWEKVGEFLAHDMPDVDDFEDVSCPDFFPMEDKWVLVCISHPRGCRYYIGDWDGKQFTPDVHRRMNWPGGTYFAPETLLDDRGRRILWAWVLDRRSGATSGTMSMPRVLRLAEDKRSLLIEPPEEIERLRFNPKSVGPFTVAAGQSVPLEGIRGDCLELRLTIAPGSARRFGVRVRCSKDGREWTPVVVDRDKGILQVDVRPSSLDKPTYQEFVMRNPNPEVETQDAPFALEDGEKLQLRVFLDHAMLEAFANGRQCITQVIYPTLDDALGIQVFCDDGSIQVEAVEAWELAPTMQW